VRTLAEYRALLPDVRRVLARHAGVVGVGIGTSTTGDELAWRVYVAGAVAGGAELPQKLLGLSVELVAAARGFENAGESVYTAGIEIETNHDEGGGALGCFARALGSGRPDGVANGAPVLLSCSHVLFPGFRVIPNPGVYFPKFSSCCSNGRKFATPAWDPTQVEKGKYQGGFGPGIPAKIGSMIGATQPGHAHETDCAIASIDEGALFRNVIAFEQKDANGDTQVEVIPIKGAVTEGLGIGKGPNFGTAPTASQYVRIWSTNSGRLMHGTMFSTPPADIAHFDDPDKIVYRWGIEDAGDASVGAMTNVNQFLILPRPTPVAGQEGDPALYAQSYSQYQPRLSFDHGDSGSIVLNSQNLVVGMIIRAKPLSDLPIARNVMELESVGNLAFATPIKAILDLLAIEIPNDTEGFTNAGPARDRPLRVFVPDDLSGGDDREDAEQRRGADRLRTRLRASRRGKLVLGKIAVHRREIRRLLASVRAIAAAWRDLEGPAFYHHGLRSAREPSHAVPVSIDGVSRERLVDVMLPLFAEHGSPALRRDIERYSEWALATFMEVATLAEVPDAAARRWRRP
jgi:hypothetical protein